MRQDRPGGGLRETDVLPKRPKCPLAVSAGWRRVMATDVFALHAQGRTRVIYETRPLDSVNASIDDVLKGKARARLVLTP